MSEPTMEQVEEFLRHNAPGELWAKVEAELALLRQRPTMADMQAQRDSLVRQGAELIDQLRAERDEADRRAGAAEREVAQLKDDAMRRNDWLHRAKGEWGVDDRVSFDTVWAQALEARYLLKAAEDRVAYLERTYISLKHD